MWLAWSGLELLGRIPCLVGELEREAARCDPQRCEDDVGWPWGGQPREPVTVCRGRRGSEKRELTRG